LERSCPPEIRQDAYRFQARLLDMVEQAVIATDLEGKILYWNRFAEQLYGWSADEVLGRDLMDVIPNPEWQERAMEEMDRLRQGGSFAGEFSVRRKDGTTFPAMVNSSGIWNEEGELIGLVGISSDLTDRKRADEALRESEQRYRTLFEKTVNPILVIDTEGNYVACNDAALEFLECSRQELLTKNVRDFVNPDRGEVVLEDHRPLWRSGGSIETEYYVNGRIKILELSITPATWLGRQVVFGLGKDVTERKRAEEEIRAYTQELEVLVDEKVQELELERAKAIQNAKLAALGQMATGVAHELNQPMTAMQFEADYLRHLARQTGEDDQVRLEAVELMKMGNDIAADVARCRRIIDHLRTFARISGGEPVLTNLNEPVERSFALMARELEQLDIDVDLQLAPDLPLIMADANRLEQVFVNLISNAADAIQEMDRRVASGAVSRPHDRRQLRVTTVVEDEHVVVVIDDTGCGIAEPNQEHIFEPFFTTKPVGKGTGLGLSISHGIVTRFGGQITFESEENRGTTFILRFPAVKR
jgi:histidine kinase